MFGPCYTGAYKISYTEVVVFAVQDVLYRVLGFGGLIGINV